MRCGLFGKLPSRRDFISYDLPRDFLTVWENWLQASVAASKVKLGEAWQSVFLTAPIWRFWLGETFCGTSVAGAMMPSVDRVGRYFPLTICACAPPGAAIEPPPVNPLANWFAAVESVLLATLDDGFDGDARGLLAGLEFPPAARQDSGGQSPARSAAVSLVSAVDADKIETEMRRFASEKLGCSYRFLTYWWTLGHRGQSGQIAVWSAMPDPYAFGGFLTGRFDP
jgi:type VI secretion system protein ImpM